MGEVVSMAEWREAAKFPRPDFDPFAYSRDWFYLAACWFVMIAEVLEERNV